MCTSFEYSLFFKKGYDSDEFRDIVQRVGEEDIIIGSDIPPVQILDEYIPSPGPANSTNICGESLNIRGFVIRRENRVFYVLYTSSFDNSSSRIKIYLLETSPNNIMDLIFQFPRRQIISIYQMLGDTGRFKYSMYIGERYRFRLGSDIFPIKIIEEAGLERYIIKQTSSLFDVCMRENSLKEIREIKILPY